MSESTKMGGAMPDAVVFETYLEAHQEASRRRARDATHGLVYKVVKSPYGNGYTIRSRPVGALADTELRVVFRKDRVAYAGI